MTAYKGAEFWMRVTLAILAGALFLTVHAVYWPVVISLILTFILMPIRDGVIKGLRRLTGRQVPIDIAILISFVILIVIVNLRGGWKELDAGTWKPGDKSTLKVSVAASYYKLTIDDEELIEIDAINLVRKVGGTDQMEAVRAAIGL